MSSSLSKVVSKFSGQRILIFGDIILDEYVWGVATKLSPEASVPVIEVEHISYMPGGAANVAANIASLRGQAYLVGVIGNDSTGERLLHCLKTWQIDTTGLVRENTRPTTLKTRYLAQNRQVIRIDREVKLPISESTATFFRNYIVDILPSVDLIVISDYAKGVTVPELTQNIISAARELNKVVVVDPKGRDAAKYLGTTVITPNLEEAIAMLGFTDRQIESSIEALGYKLLNQVNCDVVLITRGRDGMSVFQRYSEVLHLPTRSREVYDVTGAGDTVVATLSLALTTGASLTDSIKIANYAAGVVVERAGTAVISHDELIQILQD